jgi:biotin transport system substrate-specific component
MSIQLGIEKPLIDRVVSRSFIHDVALVFGGAALTAVLAQIAIPMWPVPITGQTFAVLLVGAVLGVTRGALSLIAYLAIGAAGLPVFSGLASGLTFGPTFGYLAGFVAAAAVVGFFAQLGWQKRWVGVIASFVIGNLVIYAFGLSWLALSLGTLGLANDLNAVLTAGLIPFLIGDAIKIALAALALPLAWKLLSSR